MNYRRAFVQNSCVHIVIVSYLRKSIFINNIGVLRLAFKNTLKNYKFEIIAACVLPNHVHMIIQPEKIEEYPKIISSIKHCFSRNVRQICPTYDIAYGYSNKREKGIFQRRYFEHTIKDENDLSKHLDYIHYNPVKHGCAKTAKEWKYSSFHKFVKNGLYDTTWGNYDDIKDIINFDFE